MLNWSCNYIYKSPIWVSEDLRDGNQSLIDGYNIKKKLKIWNFLLKIGIKQIVLGFPSSNKHDYNFIKYLIKNKLIPKNIIVSILVPCKKNLIDLSFKCMENVENVIFHLYNSISKKQRKIVFKFSKNKTLNFTINSILYIIKKLKKNQKLYLQYSPESFSDSEIFFSKKICYYFSYYCYINKINSIVNFPITVENCFLNYYLNYVKYIKKNIFDSILSSHIHNDMGGALSTSILSILFGIKRIEGTLLGNGERAGNSSIFILAANLYNLGIDPNINILKNNFNEIFNNEKISIKNRIPWLSRLNYSAFSGSHQDAIFKSYIKKKKFIWDIIYIPINPKIFKFKHKNIIKINSQSGRGSIRFVFWYNYNILFNKNIINKIYILSQEISEILMCEIYNEMFLSLLHCRSNNIFFLKFKLLNFQISIILNFKIIFLIIKKNKKKILKFIINKYE